MKKQINYLIMLIFSTIILSSCEKDNGNFKDVKNGTVVTTNSDVFSCTTWLFTGTSSGSSSDSSEIELVFDSVGNVQMGVRTVPYSVDSNVITLYHPDATSRSHRFILSEDNQSVKFLDNFNFTLQSIIWDTTYFERIN